MDHVQLKYGDFEPVLTPGQGLRIYGESPEAGRFECLAGGSLAHNSQKSVPAELFFNRVEIGSDAQDILRLDALIADADGRLWQTTEFVQMNDVYEDIVSQPMYALGATLGPWVMIEGARDFDRVSSRTLLRDAKSFSDARDERLLRIVVVPEVDRPQSGMYSILFRVVEKYWSAQFDIVEVEKVREGERAYVAVQPQVVIREIPDCDSNVAMTHRNEAVPIGRVSLRSLLPLSREFRWGKYVWRNRLQRGTSEEVHDWVHGKRPVPPVARPTDLRGDPNPDIRYQRG